MNRVRQEKERLFMISLHSIGHVFSPTRTEDERHGPVASPLLPATVLVPDEV
jgi:hypothetical protein